MDNCTGEKNRFVFGVAALLVFLRLFSAVDIHFLLRGHTHDVVDAAFGAVHRTFRHQGTSFGLFVKAALCRSHFLMHSISDQVLTLGDFAETLPSAFSHLPVLPVLAVLEKASNCVDYFTPLLRNIDNHTGMKKGANTGGPRAFRFMELADGNIGMLNKTLLVV